MSASPIAETRQKRANFLLQKAILEKVIKSWKFYNRRIRRGKLQIKTKTLAPVFRAWIEVMTFKKWADFVVKKHTHKKYSIIMENGFIAWTKYAKKVIQCRKQLDRIYDDDEDQAIIKSWKNWREAFLRRVRQRCNAVKQSKALIQEKKTKLFQYWLQKAKTALRKRHLEHIGLKYAMDRVMTNYWKTWRKRYLRTLTIVYETGKLLHVKESVVVAKVLTAWRELVPALRRETQANYAASLQYNWTLAKRSIIAWTRFRDSAMSKAHLYTILEDDNSTRIKRKGLRGLALYRKYRQRQAFTDRLAVPAIRRNRRRNIFRHWFNKALLYSSSRYLAEAFVKLAAKRFMRKLSQNVYLYNLTYTYLEVHRQRACKKLVLSALARYLKKRRALFLAARKFRPAHKQNLKVCTWQKWKRAYHKTQSSWRLFAFTIFYIKKELQQKMFHFWKLYINKRLRAKYCTIHRVLYLRKYIIAKWSAWTKKRMYLMEKGQNAATQEKIKTRREIFSWWLFTAYRRQDVRFKGMTIEGNRRRILFGKWRDALEWSLTKEVKIEKFQMKSIIDAQKRFIYKIYGQVQARKFAEGLNRLAQQHYQKIRRRQTFARWAYFKNVCMLNDSITSQIAYNIQGKTVKSIFSSWLEQSGARIKKVSALSKFCIALSKGLVGTWMDRWVDEVSRIVAVDSKVPSTDNFYVKKIMKKMFGYYKLYTAKRIERKEMYARVEDRFIQKRKATSVAAFNAARKQQQGKRAKIESADGLQRRRLLRKMLGAWARSNAQKHSMEDRIVLFKDRQLKRLGPLVFANLSKNVETQFTARENEQKSKNFASQYRKSTVIAYWKDLVDRNNMLFNNYHEFVNKKSFDTRAQTFNAIAKFTRDRQLMATNRLHLLQTISSVNNSNLLAMTFNSLSFFANQSKSAEENTKTQLMESKTRRLLRSWLNASRSLAEDAIKTARIEETINSRLRRELFKKWEMMFNRSFGIRKMQFKKARKQSVAILSKWLRWARINKHMRVTGSSANILLKKRCFDNLIFYASSSQKAVQKLTHVATIDLQNNFASCWDGMKKFLAQTSSTKSLLYRKRGNLARAIMSAWSHQVQLSLKLESFRLRIVETSIKKHFGAWQEALAIEQGKHTKLISILNGRYKRITKSALSSWKDLTRELALDELCYTQAIIPNTMNKMQNIFYSWRLVIERKLYLDECVAQWQKDRSAYILQCCFENWYGGVKPLLIANNKLESHKRRKRRSFKVKVFLSWVCYSRKQQKLKKTSVLAQQLTAQHVKEAHLHLWFKRYHLILMGREYAKSREQATVSTMFYFWLRLYESKTVNALLKRILTKQAMKTKAGMFQRWVQTSVFDEADIEKAEIFYAGLQERRIRRFFHNFRILAEDRIITGEVHDDIRSYFLLNKARRCFTAFKAACELQKIKREQYAHAEYKYYESLLLKVLLSLRDYACRHIESHIRIEENEIVALDFWREELMKKTFYRWLEWYNEGIYRRARSKLYEIFSSWKLYTRERSLLKRYLKESNLSDRYLHSSRESIPQITNRSQAYWTMRSISSNESKELDEAERLRIPSPSFPNTNS